MGKASGKALDYCTSAFNVADQTGALYTSTAGHCFTLLKNAATIVSPKYGTIIANKDEAGSAIDDNLTPRRDFAFVRVPDVPTWYPAGKPRNIDYFHCSKQPQPSPCDPSLNKHRYRITALKAYADMSVGEVVCMSGASPRKGEVAPGTRCGAITELPDGGIRTNICAKRGDSGSPLFDQVTRTAYGIESSVESESGDQGLCVTADKQKTNYTALSAALTAAGQMNHGRTYHLITQ
jgi:streptogrisin C